MTLTLDPATVAAIDRHATERGTTRSAAIDAIVASHEAMSRGRLPGVSREVIAYLSGLLREFGANPGLDPSRRLLALAAVARAMRTDPRDAAILDAVDAVLAHAAPDARAALLVEVERGVGTA